MPTSQNRTKWPITGGAVGIQPGWFAGHSQAQIYINMGFGNEPRNMSHPMLPVFEIIGPTNSVYQGEICLPQVPLPANITVKVGDNATIQVIELAQHGAALYNVSLFFPARFYAQELLFADFFGHTVRRHHFRRTRGRRRGQRDELPQLDGARQGDQVWPDLPHQRDRRRTGSPQRRDHLVPRADRRRTYRSDFRPVVRFRASFEL